MSTSSDIPGSENLLPRRYQEEVFSQAQQRNVIAALDTGSGKTFISTLLVKWTASRETSQGKVIIFLVPKVTLVEQQGDFIEKHSPLRVIKLHGALEIDLTDKVGWRKKFERHDVFVMTGMSLRFHPYNLSIDYRHISSDIHEPSDTLALEHQQGTLSKSGIS
jgi:ERCC4-related helicase